MTKRVNLDDLRKERPSLNWAGSGKRVVRKDRITMADLRKKVGVEAKTPPPPKKPAE